MVSKGTWLAGKTADDDEITDAKRPAGLRWLEMACTNKMGCNRRVKQQGPDRSWYGTAQEERWRTPLSIGNVTSGRRHTFFLKQGEPQ